jgi:hypothetical protein
MLKALTDLHNFLDTISLSSTVVKNSARSWLNSWFPKEIDPVCPYDWDYICIGTNGAKKLADVLPQFATDTLDVLWDNHLKVAGTLAVSAVMLTAFCCFCCRRKTASLRDGALPHHNLPPLSDAPIGSGAQPSASSSERAKPFPGVLPEAQRQRLQIGRSEEQTSRRKETERPSSQKTHAPSEEESSDSRKRKKKKSGKSVSSSE